MLTCYKKIYNDIFIIAILTVVLVLSAVLLYFCKQQRCGSYTHKADSSYSAMEERKEYFDTVDRPLASVANPIYFHQKDLNFI